MESYFGVFFYKKLKLLEDSKSPIVLCFVLFTLNQ